MRRRLGALALCLCLASSASSLDLEGIECVCADDRTSRTDYLDCLAHFTRRLVASGTMTEGARSRYLREARRLPLPADEPSCRKGTWGVGVQVDRPVHSVGGTARLEGMVCNLSAADATGVAPAGGGLDGPDECLLALEIRLRDWYLGDPVVHRATLPCGAATTEFPLEAGRIRRFAADVALVHLHSDIEPDGTPLAPGFYRARVETRAGVPNRSPVDSVSRASSQLLLQVIP